MTMSRLGCFGARVRACSRRFGRARRAAAAVEFALVGGTFLVLITLILELSLFYLRVTTFDYAVQKVSRQLLINNPPSASAFVTAVKANSFGVLNGETIYVAVQSAATFGAITPVANISAGGTLPYAPGTTGQAELVQVGYQDTTLFGLIAAVGNVASAIAFQTEPPA